MAAKQLVINDVVCDSVHRNQKGCTAKMHAPVPAKLAAALGWDELPESYAGGNLETDLHATQLSLTPKGEGATAKFAFDLKARRMFGFVVVRKELEGKRGKGKNLVASWTVEFNEEGAGAKVEKYIVNCGEIKGKLHVNYEPAAQQGTLVDVTNTQSEADSSLFAN